MRTQMRQTNRGLLVGALLMLASPAFAQTTIDPSGHWTGAIHVPPFNGAGSREVAIEIDLAKNASGGVDGRFSQQAQNLKGLPLSKVSVEGRSVTFELRAANGGGLFHGTLAAGASIAGEFVTTEGGYNIPFDLKRTGDAQIAPAPRSTQVGKEFEGSWRGAIDVGGRSERLILTMTNHDDGTASGTIIDVDGSNVEIPIAMTQQAANLTVEIATVGATYTGSLNAANEIVGQWKQGQVNLPLTFSRVSQ